MTRAPSDLASLRTISVDTLAALAGGHTLGTPGTNGRAHGGRTRGARDRQSSALKRLFTLKESAVYLGVGYGKVRGFVERGLLPIVKLPGGKFLHITVDDLERFVLAHREAAMIGAVRQESPSPRQPPETRSNRLDQGLFCGRPGLGIPPQLRPSGAHMTAEPHTADRCGLAMFEAALRAAEGKTRRGVRGVGEPGVGGDDPATRRAPAVDCGGVGGRRSATPNPNRRIRR